MSKVTQQLRPGWESVSQSDFRQAFQKLNSVRDLANLLGLGYGQLNYYAFHANKRSAYQTFYIPRRNGKERKIDAPSRTLKYIQRVIHESMTKIYGPHPAVHGFIAGRSIVTNAANHTGRPYILNIDLADFFPSITRKRIYGRLNSSPYLIHREVSKCDCFIDHER